MIAICLATPDCTHSGSSQDVPLHARFHTGPVETKVGGMANELEFARKSSDGIPFQEYDLADLGLVRHLCLLHKRKECFQRLSASGAY